jgi:hypothetical protein
VSSGNPDLATVWGGADVLVGSESAVIPTAGNGYGLYRTQTITTTSADATISFASGTITAKDVGLSITGTGIPASTTILSITNLTTAELSQNATGSSSPTATIGATNGWRFAGCLDGSQGFEETNDQSSTDHSAWGFGVIATTYQDKKTTVTFTALEENAVVMGLVYDVSGMTFDDVAGTYAGNLAVREDTDRVRLGFEVTSGDVVRRKTTANYATVIASGAGSESEESLGSKTFEASIFPDENNALYTVYKGAV